MDGAECWKSEAPGRAVAAALENPVEGRPGNDVAPVCLRALEKSDFCIKAPVNN
jgi:hypothetical protein